MAQAPRILQTGAIAAALTRLRTSAYTPGGSVATRPADQDGMYSPLQPVQPLGAPGTQPKAFQFNVGQNLIFTPRPDAEYSAETLKRLASYDMARVLIENVKDVVTNTPWEIHLRKMPGEPNKAHKEREAGDENISVLSKFFECPDGEAMWPDWLRPLLEDMLVIDAPAILIRPLVNGKIAQLRVLRGESITRYIDENGYTPAPPEPAYAQNWWGMPLVNLTTDQLVYKPRNIVPRSTVASQLYGMSPVEQAARWIRIGQLRLNFQESYYTEGSVPGMIQVVPAGVSPDAVETTMAMLNSEMAGDFARRRQIRMMQGFQAEGKPDQFLFPKEPLLKDTFDEYVVRCLCFAFGTSPQRLLSMMNRASAEASQSAADDEGYLPFLNWVRVSVINYIIQVKMGFSDYEIVFLPKKQSNPKEEMEILTGYVAGGICTVNEAREARGDDLSDDPAADVLATLTGSGMTPIDAEKRPQPPAPIIAGAPGDEPPNPDGGGGGAAKPKQEGAASLRAKEDVKKKLLKTESASAGAAIDSGNLTAKTEVLISHFGLRLTRWLKRAGADAAGAITKRRLGKADEGADDPDDDLQREILLAGAEATPLQRHTIRALVLLAMGRMDWAGLADRSARYMDGAASQGVALGLAQVAAATAGDYTDGPDVSGSITDRATLDRAGSAAAEEFAATRSAEMVGMRRTKAGTLKPNPDARWAISDATRRDLVASITQAVVEGWTAAQLAAVIEASTAFSSTRAETIARTELARAQSFGTFCVWSLTGATVYVRWVTSEDEGVCIICEGYERQGAVPLGHAFAPGISYPCAHPNCRCSLEITAPPEDQ